jgi:nitrate/TMAO reductase-like tetraheme cytochrome c subunit
MRRLFKPQVILIIAILFVASIPLQFRATSSPNFCESCHEMTPMVASFKDSTHAAVGCMGCHTDPGQVAFVKGKIRDGFKDIYAHFFGYEKPIHTTVPNERCLTCHPTIHTRNVFQQLEVAHNTHLVKGIACVQCHLKVGHQKFTLASAGGIRHIVTRFEETHRKVTLQTCFASGCHDNKVAQARCVTCHDDQQNAMPASHRPEFLRKHGALARKDPTSCYTCHKERAPQGTMLNAALVSAAGMKPIPFKQLLRSGFCQNCHRKENRHPTGFEKTHGELAQSKGANCAVCHEDQAKFCDLCHQMTMPHPQNFILTHGRSAKAATTCERCHQKTECESCHRSKKPATHTANFIAAHGQRAKTSAEQCEFCHRKKDCEGCHRSTRPTTHAADFRAKHGALVKKDSQNCLLCHRKTTCDSCHQLEMPHPSGYKTKHGTDATQRESTCANCHLRKDCMACHEEDEVHIPKAGFDDRDSMKRLVEWLGRR